MGRTRRSLLVGGAVALSGCSGLLSNTTGRTVSTCEDRAVGWSQFQGDAANSGHSGGPAVDAGSIAPMEHETDHRAGVVVSGDSLFVGSGETLYAYDAADETQQWAVDLGDFQATPAAYCDAVLAATLNRVHAVDAADGSVIWEREVGGTTGPVAVAGETVVVPTAGSVRAFAVADGSSRWTFDREWSKHGVCLGDDTVYVTGGDVTGGFVAAVDLESGDERWSTRLTRTSYWPAAYREDVFAVDDGGTAYRIDADGGGIEWEQRVGDDGASESPGGEPRAGVDGVPGPLVTESLVVVGAGWADRTYALDVETGEQRWELETGPVLVPPVAADGEIYVGTANRGVFAVGRDGSVRWHREGPTIDSPMAVHEGSLLASKPRTREPHEFRS